MHVAKKTPNPSFVYKFFGIELTIAIQEQNLDL